MHKKCNQKPRRPIEMGKLAQVVYQINPDSEYGNWITVLMVIFNESGGSDEGLSSS